MFSEMLSKLSVVRCVVYGKALRSKIVSGVRKYHEDEKVVYIIPPCKFDRNTCSS